MLPAASAGARAGIVAASASAAVAAGFATAQSPQLALIVGVAILAVGSLALPPPYWVLAAVTAAVCFRALVAGGLLPGYAAYVDLPLTWVALALALRIATRWSPLARKVVLGLAALALATLISGMLAGSPPFRWLFGYLLMAGPFALIASLLLAPPSPPERRRLERVALGLALIQVPIVMVQAARFDDVDAVQGTFIGSEAGAHLTGGVAAAAALWYLAKSSRPKHAVIASLLLLVPFLSSAKQIIFALPAATLASPAVGRIATWLRIGLVFGALGLLVAVPSLHQTYSLRSIDDLLAGRGGKPEATREIATELTRSPLTLAFGVGPAETLSHSALLTLSPLREFESPIAALELEPASVALRLGALRDYSGSFEHPSSSVLGVFGDLGIVGAVPVFGLIGLFFRALWSHRTPEAAAGTAVLALFFVMGFIFTWWEQTGFALYVALFVGLALTGDQNPLATERPWHSRQSWKR